MKDEKEVPECDALALGRQMTVEYYDCSSAVLADAARLEQVFLNAARLSGATVVNSTFHRFEPQGVSGVIVISESHFAVHAWPEHDYAAVDLFTCGPGVHFDVAVREIAKGLGSGQYLVSSLMNRGIVGECGVERLVPVTESCDCRGLQLSWGQRFEHSHARAMSAAIDLYRCSAPGVTTEPVLRRFGAALCELLCGHSLPPESAQWAYSADSEAVEFAQRFCRGHVNGLICPGDGTIYLDLFTHGFFDPRVAAELAMRELGGGYYRMQPHVRQ